ncbi:Tetratricopeptide-like helical [Penicillium frequentans]|uniref:Tetratricopeptide-like helical n=1 Tax=Penicillium frequentans TaxID=3151616 RepID=A0AAD6CZH9_9EURO|nr:Tetratricopeptide-like helical [Penicillium glabrum]
MVPFARNRRFVGRQQEIDYLERLVFNTAGPAKVTIYGLGGIGKTQIALELAYRMREKVPESSIFWIQCTSYETVQQAYVKIAEALGIPDIEPAKIEEQVRAHLSQDSAGKWLLIFDNADDMEMWTKGSVTAPPLKNVLPCSENGHILFTSRNRKLAVRLSSPDVLSIPNVDETTATKILENSLIQKGLLHDKFTTTALLEQLGFLPLAINQAAAYINEREIVLSDYLSLLKDRETDAAKLLSEDFEDDGRYAETQNPVLTTWLISFQQIQELDQLAADYLSFIACINPRDIPPSILPPSTSAKEKTDALGLLNAYCFIGKHASGSSFSLHRLVHLATRNWMRKNEVFDYWIRRATQQLDYIFPSGDHNNQRLWRVYLPHALYLMNSEEFHTIQHAYVGLSSRVGLSLQRDGRYDEAEIILADCLKVLERDLGPHHPDTLSSVSHLGSVLEQKGQYEEAEAMHHRALEGRENVLGLEHLETLSSVSHLGLVLGRKAQYGEAEALYRRALEGYEKALGLEHPDTLSIGQYEEANIMYQRALEGFERGLGLKHPHTLATVTNLGSVFAHQGQYEEAELMHRRALEGYEKALGPEHPYTLTSVRHLAFVLEQQGQHEETKTMHQRALEGFEKTLGPEHPDTLSSVTSLGLVLAHQGQYNEAELMHRRALEGYEKALGPEHPYTLTSVSHLAYVLEQQGQHEETKTMHRRALEGFEKTLGLEHLRTLSSVTSLGSVLAHQGQYEEAETMHRRALEGFEKTLGLEHLRTLTSISNLGFVLEGQGKYEEAEAMHCRVLEGREKVLGPEHPATLASKKRITFTRNQRKLRDPARMFLENHPFFRSFLSTSPLPSRYDLDEVD